MKIPFALLAGASVLLIAGCGSSSSSSSGSGSSASNDEAAPSAPTGEGKQTGNLEVAVFKGGFGSDFFEQAGTEFQAKNPGLTVKVWGDPHAPDKLRTRINGDDPPDLMFPGWDLDHWALADEGQLSLLDKALDSPAYDGKGKWRDTFDPSLLKLGQKDGKQYVLPYFLDYWGWWYDADTFAKNGWTAPKNFDELLALCEKIKAKGVAPITFQGKYPYYMLQGMLLPWAQDIGGIQVINDIQNLKPGAWKDPAILQAAQMLCTLRDKGDFQKGAVGLSHTESQSEFLLGHAAFIPCGTWLPSEMKKNWPGTDRVRVTQPVGVTGGKGDPTAVIVEIEPWMVPAKAKNPNAAVAYYKYITSLDKAKQFVSEKGTFTAIKGSDQTKIPDTLADAATAFRASKTIWSYTARQWYPAMEKEVENSITAMLNGEITAAQFCDRAEAAAQKTRDDSSISKHKVE